MTTRKRRFLFYSLLTIFFILGGAVIFYASGWRFDFKTFKAERVGAIFIRSFPENAKIYLDGKAADNGLGLFQNGIMIGNIFPKSYRLKLFLDGYEPWQENISVSPSLVTKIPYAVLVPKNFTEIAAGAIENFWLLGGNIAAEDTAGRITLNGGGVGSGEIAGWSSDFQYLLIFNKNSGAYGWFDTASGKNFNVVSALKKLGFSAAREYRVLADPTDKKRLVILEAGRISLLDTGKSTLTVVYKPRRNNSVKTVASSQFYLAWTEFNEAQNTSTLIVYDKFLRKSLGGMPEFNGGNRKLEWTSDKKVAVLQDDGGLYMYDPSNNDSQKLADDVKDFSFAGDGSAVAALEQNALEIIPLNQNQIYHKFNLPEMNSAQTIYWYADNNHLFIKYPARVNFLDLNDASLNNFITVAGDISVSRYDTDDNRLYVLKNNGLFALDFPR